MNARLSEGQPAERGLVSELKGQARLLGGFVGLLWVVQIVNSVVFGGGLAGLGVHPRTLFGLVGILFAPFIHVGFAHLIANTIPLVVLGWLVMLRNNRDLLKVSALAALVGGLGTWLIAPAMTVHVGASVLIFGYLGYLLVRGIFERRFWPIVGSLVVFFLYGGALFGVLPGQVGISWQGHLFGLLGGVLAARLMRTPPAPAGQLPTHARIAAPVARVSARAGAGEAEAEAELEAELERARAALKARSVR